MKTLTGTVVSDKMDKTVVVAVTLWREHTLYHKRYQVTRKFKAHDEKDEYAVGDTVTIAETRPLSKEKRWKVIARAQSVKGKAVERTSESPSSA